MIWLSWSRGPFVSRSNCIQASYPLLTFSSSEWFMFTVECLWISVCPEVPGEGDFLCFTSSWADSKKNTILILVGYSIEFLSQTGDFTRKDEMPGVMLLIIEEAKIMSRTFAIHIKSKMSLSSLRNLSFLRSYSAGPRIRRWDFVLNNKMTN